jgi:hypothetical protein
MGKYHVIKYTRFNEYCFIVQYPNGNYGRTVWSMNARPPIQKLALAMVQYNAHVNYTLRRMFDKSESAVITLSERAANALWIESRPVVVWTWIPRAIVIPFVEDVD